MSSFLKELLNETRKINEEDLFSDAEVGPEVAAEVPAEAPIEGEECPGCPEITDELVAELAEANPAIAEVDAAEFKAGLECEVGCLESVGGDMNVVANIVLCKLSKFPGKDYYGALKTMEASLMEPETSEEMPVEEEMVDDTQVETPEPSVEESAETTGTDTTKQPDGKAMSQVKNESTTDGVVKAKYPGTATHPDEKQDEEDQKKTWAKEKAQEEELMKTQAADDKKKNVAEASVGADMQAKASVTSAAKDASKDHAKTTANASMHKAEDKKDMNKKDVNPIKVKASGA